MKKYDGYYIVRAKDAGVFAGKIKEREGDTVVMNEAILLYSWSGAASLNQLANEGVKCPQNCKFTVPVDEIEVFNVIEILKCTDEAEANIKAVPVWTIK